MSNSSTPNDAQAPAGSIEFIQYHQPGLKDGDYEITIKQEISATASAQKITTENKFEAKRRFTVAGERFELKPSDIYAVFPPDRSLGEHSNALPHLILNRSTLPWERMADGSSKDIPWLILLLFDHQEKLSGMIEKQEFLTNYAALNLTGSDGAAVWNHLLDRSIGWLKANKQADRAAIRAKERRASKTLKGRFAGLESQIEAILDQARTPKVLALRELKNKSDEVLKWPGVQLETGQQEDDKVTVIDIEKGLLEQLLPAKDELAWLAHVRQEKDSANHVMGDELAIVSGNRLPLKGGLSAVHLVSVEGRYAQSGFNYQGAEDDDLIRLVSLKSWSFACEDERKSFKGLLLNLNERLSAPNRSPSTLRLPAHNNVEAEKYLAQGYVPLPHYFRQGARTVSWYHGPLIPGENTTELTLPVRAADELVRYDPAIGLFDVSYAAAWGLGRSLALQSQQFSTGLFQWKRTYVQQLSQVQQQLLHPHLPGQGKSVAAGLLPEELSSWFRSLSLLQGVPFNYLVPDERLLPPESIRFFRVDGLWMECLLDGAFSIGRVTTSDYEKDQAHAAKGLAANPFETVTGFLLRSDVVAGWPGLLVDAYSDIAGRLPLTLLRVERLAANVLLCLFEGEMKSVAVHQKPETLHFGLDKSDKSHPGFYKKLRDNQGQEDEKLIIDPIPWRSETQRVINIAGMAADMAKQVKATTSAHFALQMIEGVEKVVFVAK